MSFSTISYVNVTPATFTRNVYIDSSSSILTRISLGEGWTSVNTDTFLNELNLIAISLPSSLTSIGNNAFKNAVYLNSVTFNNSPTSMLNIIGASAFFNAIRLTQITIPANVTTISASAFENASGLTSITFDTGSIYGSTLSFIYERAFAGATKLTQINIPSSVVHIGQDAFLNTTSLTQFIVSGSNFNYSSDAYGVLFNKTKTILIQYPIGSTVTRYDIPTTVLTVAQNAFNGAIALTSITIPASVISIGDKTFGNMFKLSSITVNPSNLYYSSDTVGALFDKNKTQLFQYPSSNNSTTYTIPTTVTWMAMNAFMNSTKLTAFSIDSTNNVYSTDVSGVLFNKNKTGLVQYPIGNTQTSYTIPGSVVYLAPVAFYGASYLTSISFPLGCYYNYFSDYDHSGMTSLRYISTYQQRSSNSFLTQSGGVLFDKNLTILYKYPSNKGTNILKNGNYIFTPDTSYTIPNTVTEIATGAFDGAIYLKTVIINTIVFNKTFSPYGYKLTKIGSNAFKNSGLINVILANSYNVGDIDLYVGTNQPFYGKSNVTVSIYNKTLSGTGQLNKKNLQLQNANNIDIQNYSSIGVAAFKDILSITKITIPSSVTDIGMESFRGTTYLRTVIFNGYPTSIQDSTFQGALSLITIIIPSTVISIGANAFKDAASLTSITFSKNGYDTTVITSIQTSAFQGASSLTTIEIPSTVISIGAYAFKDAYSLRSITFPQNSLDRPFSQNSQLTTIGDYAFQGASLLSIITIPASVTSIGANAFTGSAITSVIFEESTLLDGLGIVPGFNRTLYGKTGIAVAHTTKVFTGSGRLSVVTNASLNGATRARIAEGYTSIGRSWDTNNLTRLTIPSSITDIHNVGVFTKAFANCPNLKNIIFESSTSLTTFGVNVGSVAFFRGATNLTISIITKVFSGSGELTGGTANLQGATKVIIENYSSIGSRAFDRAVDKASILESVTIRSSVTSINSAAFVDCIHLRSIIFESGSQLKTITNGTFWQAMNLTSITIPSTVTSIEQHAFYGTVNLTSIIIPESVTSIESPFTNSGITTITFNTSKYLNTVGLTSGQGKNIFDLYNVNVLVTTQIFKGLGELTNAASYFLGENPSKYAVIEDYNTIGANVFKNVTGLQAIDILSRLTVIKDSAFESTTSLTEITIPYTVSIIGQYAFRQSGIKSITFTAPALLTNIGNYAFTDCSGLTQITIPNLVTSIGSYAFSNATSLTKVTLSNTITNIADHLFHGAIALTTINIPDSVTRIGEYAFTDCSALRQLVISVKVTRIDDFAFKNSGLTQIYIPANVTSIGISAFTGTQLTSVTFDPDCDIANIGANAFAGCSKLTLVKMNQYDIDTLIESYPSSISLNSNRTIFTKFFGATNVTYTDNSPSSTPICFPKGTPVTTNQGNIAIELLNPDIHTIRNKRIIAITQSRPLHKYIVSIEKDALGSNIPNAKTQISKEHKVYYKGEMIKAKDLVNLCNGVTKIPYTGETLYNVLMEKHDKMMINNLICETLHPDNILAKIHNGKYTSDEKNKLYRKLTELIESGDEPAYNKFYATLR